MKAVVMTDGRIEQREIEFQSLLSQWARIKVVKTGLCGSDVAKIVSCTLPAGHSWILGHEFYGQIVELNGLTRDISVGDWVVGMPVLACGECFACSHQHENLCAEDQAIGRTLHGAFAEFVDVPISNAIKIPASHLLDPYVLSDPLAVCIHASKLNGSASGSESCLVMGDGPIGCLLAWLLHEQGHEVWLKGIHQENHWFIEGLGVKITAEELPKGHFDTIYETVGRSQSCTLSESLEIVRVGGSVVVLGVFTPSYTYPLLARNFFIKEVKTLGSNSYLRSEFKEAVRLIELHHKTLSSFISHRFPLARFADAITLAQHKQGFTMKIVIEMGG